MSARRRALLSLAPLLLIGAAPAEPVPHSLIVGRWASDRLVDVPPCPEPAICAGGIYDVGLADVDTLSGPAVPARLTVRVSTVRIRPPRDDYRAIFIVRPDGAGRPWAGILLQTAISGRESCIRSYWLDILEVPRPRRAYRRGEETCFRAA